MCSLAPHCDIVVSLADQPGARPCGVRAAQPAEQRAERCLGVRPRGLSLPLSSLHLSLSYILLTHRLVGRGRWCAHKDGVAVRARLLQRARAQPDTSHDEERQDSALSAMAHPRVAVGRSQGSVLSSILRKDTEHCEALLRVAALTEARHRGRRYFPSVARHHFRRAKLVPSRLEMPAEGQRCPSAGTCVPGTSRWARPTVQA
eukprot:scaffold45831_cov46-Phaeocystis_antarctica.AAC.2